MSETWAPMSSGGLWDTYKYWGVTAECHRLNPDPRPPQSWSHPTSHLLAACSISPQKPMAGRDSYHWFLVLLREAAERGCFPHRALAGEKCVEVSWRWWEAECSPAPWCPRQIHFLVCSWGRIWAWWLSMDWGGGSAHRCVDSWGGQCVVHLQYVCWLNSHSTVKLHPRKAICHWANVWPECSP